MRKGAWVVPAVSLATFGALSALSLRARAPSDRAPVAIASTRPLAASSSVRAPLADRVAQNDRCVQCHGEIAREWEGSLHRQSFTDEAYVRAFAIEPRRFCRNCHAPESDPKANEVPADAVALGTACISCHIAGDSEVAVLRPNMPDDHLALRDAETTSTAACGSCHEFPFPDGAARRKPELMQLTMKEHDVSTAHGVACASCHMPKVGSHRSHAFAASRDETLMRKAIAITARRTDRELELTLTLGDIGHAFPTGDLLRRIALTVKSGSFRRVRFLGRHFGNEQQMPGIVVRVVREDDRVGVLGERFRVVTFLLPETTHDEVVTWNAEYQRVEHLGAEGESDALVGGAIMLAEGSIPPK